MTPRSQWILFVACMAVTIVGVLVATGIAVKSDWDTFVPDLIIGVVGAAVIGLLLMVLQQSDDRRRSHAADVSAAYNKLLDNLTPLRTMNIAKDDPSQVSATRTSMLQLYEAVDVAGDQPAFGSWINAEAQLVMFRIASSMEVLRTVTNRSDAAAVLAAAAPFHRWVAEFTHNLRFWRTGRFEEPALRMQAEAIESLLREKGVWQEGAVSWSED